MSGQSCRGRLSLASHAAGALAFRPPARAAKPLQAGARAPICSRSWPRNPTPITKSFAENRRARFDYFIESDLEVGIVLTGSEVKALRTGQSNIAESYASIEGASCG